MRYNDPIERQGIISDPTLFSTPGIIPRSLQHFALSLSLSLRILFHQETDGQKGCDVARLLRLIVMESKAISQAKSHISF